MQNKGFFAYPAEHNAIRDAILGAVALSEGTNLQIKPWEKMQIVGFKLDDLIRDQIDEVDILIADITYPNCNVFYEIGYAIGKRKPIICTLNTAIEKSVMRVQQIGLFDTLGWATYENGEGLQSALSDWESSQWLNNYYRKKNHEQPLFILDTVAKTEFRQQIFRAVDNSNVNYRPFDPLETPRLTASQAIAEVSASSGIILPFLDYEIVDSERHNLRASFLLGLAHGDGINALAIQYENTPVALDYRDFVTNSTYRHETDGHVSRFCAETLIWNQRAGQIQTTGHRSVLSQIDMGSPSAENEAQSLPHYFVETAEYSRALRAESAIVSGRKGSGKTAVFFQICASAYRDKRCCVVDLRPSSHNLSEMRQALLSVVSQGVFEHTIAAFWQYIIYVEILLKIREMSLFHARNDFQLQERVRNMEDAFSLNEAVVSGDFTSRLETAVQNVVQYVRNSEDARDLRTRITNAMFEEPIPRLRDTIVSFSDQFTDVYVLIDDLDKGWPPLRVEGLDVNTLKHLKEVLVRIQRDLSRRSIQMRHLLFLRSDVYEKLVEGTADRGKYNVINVDWSDPEQLRSLLKRRVISNVSYEDQETAWSVINPILEKGCDAVACMIDHSLRRPRFLIDLCERILSFSVNRGHDLVTEDDVHEGLRQMSLYLVSDFGYEMRDVAGTPETVFYRFLGSSDLLTHQEICEILLKKDINLSSEDAIDLLIWYGFLGIVNDSSEAIFIYDRAYDFRRLEAERTSKREDALYAVNAAFLLGLERG